MEIFTDFYNLKFILMKKLNFIFLFFTISIFSQNRNYMLAENYFKNNEFEKAISFYEKLYETNPYNLNYLNKLITCFQETNQYPKAENYLKNKLKENSKMIFLNVLIGKNYEKQKNKEKATQFYKKAVLDIEKQVSFGRTVANMFEKINKLNYAIKAYQKIAKLKKINYDLNIADLYGQQGKFKEMFETYFNYVDKKNNTVNRIIYKTAPYINDDSENPNNILFKNLLLKRLSENPKTEWNKLLGWLFAKQKNYDKAFIQGKALFMRKKIRLYEIYLLGVSAFENKTYSDAREIFNFIIKKSEQESEKMNALSYILKIDIAEHQKNLEEKFITILEKYGTNNKTLNIQLIYADYLTFHKNQAKKAKEILEKALKNAYTNHTRASIKLKLGDVLVYQNIFNKALIYFSQIQSEFKNHELGQSARFKVAQTSYFKGDFEWAKAQVKVLKSSASQLIANDAADLFLTISDNQPKDSIPTGLKKFAKANLFAYQNNNEKALKLLDEIIHSYKGQGIEDDALFESGKIFTKQKNYTKAIENYTAILKIPESTFIDDSLYYLGEIYSEKKEYDNAKKYYEKIVLEHPSSIFLVDARKKFRQLRGK